MVFLADLQLSELNRLTSAHELLLTFFPTLLTLNTPLTCAIELMGKVFIENVL